MFNLFQELDDSILFYILNHLHTPFLDYFMISVTTLGNSGFIWIVAAFLLLLNRKTRPCGVLLTISLTLSYFLGDGILKPFFMRERPFIRYPYVNLLIHPPGSFSFPSGHTMSSFTAATIIVYYYPYAGASALFLAFLMGFSRLYLFFHYPTDVLGGALFGTAVSLLVILSARYLRRKAGLPLK